MATDIMDKDLKALRNDRWDKAFKECSDEGTKHAVNRKATIVIEHLIQASDVSHTMQHWHVRYAISFCIYCILCESDNKYKNRTDLFVVTLTPL